MPADEPAVAVATAVTHQLTVPSGFHGPPPVAAPPPDSSRTCLPEFPIRDRDRRRPHLSET